MPRMKYSSIVLVAICGVESLLVALSRSNGTRTGREGGGPEGDEDSKDADERAGDAGDDGSSTSGAEGGMNGRQPQSEQSVPKAQASEREPVPPSSHTPFFAAASHELVHFRTRPVERTSGEGVDKGGINEGSGRLGEGVGADGDGGGGGPGGTWP